MDEPTPPTLVRTAAGRLEPFDSGRVSRDLFAASEAMGRPDPFLARELADGVVHFLADECGDATVTSAQIAEVVAKTVRELGHPLLAAAYEARRAAPPDESGYARDVRAAHDAGLIRLDDIGCLAAWVLPTGGGRGAVLNRNLPTLVEQSPLFGPGPPPADVAIEAPGHEPMIDWHLDNEVPPDDVTAFVLDRPRRPVAFGLGIDADHPAALARVGLNLPALAGQPGLLADQERYLLRVGSLVRLALDAGIRKRGNLRRSGTMAAGFVVERARFVAVAEGLDEAVRLFTGWGLANGGASLEFGRRIAARLRDVLRKDGRAVHLDTFLEIDVTGGEVMSIGAQMDAGDAIHAECDGGTLYTHGNRAEVLQAARARTGIHRIVIR